MPRSAGIASIRWMRLTTTVATAATASGRFLQWYYRPVWIMVLTVMALGPLSLLLVWRTPRLGRTGRWIATVVILGVTAYLGYQLWQTLRMVHSLLFS